MISSVGRPRPSPAAKSKDGTDGTGAVFFVVKGFRMACRAYTGKNDLTRRVTRREAVFGSVIHSIFDAWHYKVLWTCTLTRLL